MRWMGVFGVVGAACGSSSTPLAHMGPMRLDAGAETIGVRDVLVSLTALDASCPTIEDGATATFDGLPMKHWSAGGPYEDRTGGGDIKGCNPIELLLEADQVAPLFGASATDTIVIHDSSATWTAEIDNFLTTDVAMIGTPATNGQVTLRWPSVTTNWLPSATLQDASGAPITEWHCPYTDPNDGCYDGIHMFAFVASGSDWTFTITWQTSGLTAKPPQTSGFLVVDAWHHATARVCDGPQECDVMAEGVSPPYAVTLF